MRVDHIPWSARTFLVATLIKIEAAYYHYNKKDNKLYNNDYVSWG